MSKRIKNITIFINFIILILAILWTIDSKFQYEPITVLLGQLLSLIVLVFGDKIQNSFSVKKISKSTVDIDTNKEDDAEYNISDITDGSEIKIKKR